MSLFEDYETSSLLNLILYIKRNEDKQNLVWVYDEAFAELKKRNPIMSKLYSYQLVFLDEKDDIVREDENEQESNSINN